jgi:hypothetical protein
LSRAGADSISRDIVVHRMADKGLAAPLTDCGSRVWSHDALR